MIFIMQICKKHDGTLGFSWKGKRKLLYWMVKSFLLDSESVLTDYQFNSISFPGLNNLFPWLENYFLDLNNPFKLQSKWVYNFASFWENHALPVLMRVGKPSVNASNLGLRWWLQWHLQDKEDSEASTHQSIRECDQLLLQVYYNALLHTCFIMAMWYISYFFFSFFLSAAYFLFS